MAILAFIIVSLASMAPGVQATPLEDLLPPGDFTASYNATTHTIHLTWLPPGNNTTTPFVYHVYRNGDLIANTTHTWYEDMVSFQYNLYYVTAQDEDGFESPPTQPLLVQQHGSWSGFNPVMLPYLPLPFQLRGPCDIVTFSIGGQFPFVAWGIHWECLGSAGRAFPGMFPPNAEIILG